MIDKNMLWERFVYVSLRKGLQKEKAGFTIQNQVQKFFWKPERGSRSQIRPDIVINKDKADCVVLDTKWKNLNGYNHSPEDLRQLYVYHLYYGAEKVALVYPDNRQSHRNWKFLCTKTGEATDMECSVIYLTVKDNIDAWQKAIYSEVRDWLHKSDQLITSQNISA